MNEYPGICFRCGERVKALGGDIEPVGWKHRVRWPHIYGRWMLEHTKCAELYHDTDVHFIFNPIHEDCEVLDDD